MALIRMKEQRSWRKHRIQRPNAGIEADTTNPFAQRSTFGLLPEAEKRPASFITSTIINGSILALILLMTVFAKHTIQAHLTEQAELIIPNTPPAQKVKPPTPVKLPERVKLPEVKFEEQKIRIPRPEPKPEVKPIQLEAKLQTPLMKDAKPNVILAPQPKAALTAAMPAQDNHLKPSTAPVHLGATFGVTPNPNATRPATIAAVGNPYGGMQGPSVAPHGVVGSTGIGNGLKSGSNSGVIGKVASAGIPASTTASATGPAGKVGSVNIPKATTVAAVQTVAAAPTSTNLEILSKPPVQYTAEAKQLRIQGDVVLRVTFTASGQVTVHGVVRGLGHGLDEEARRVAGQIRFRPATRNGQAVDSPTTITITFQLA